jgi:hypothetical protein
MIIAYTDLSDARARIYVEPVEPVEVSLGVARRDS